ncbi:MerR family transcriptional regulator [Tsukamurella paurometabola]|uniref:HTH-type transcriptional regulator AdhR n=1 Tax=Tsukamurella paurometabola TaxID=2061 RepID=A0A3P8JYF1_TSUPA|nr:MerR family transcriptional regulator [Tsukamurella paurometabola]MBS4103789.1 MerR family transcriptional regulator [Tsukamurella paurometabola]UEA85243.1 MerR family transcriptional regulator [Tsukamurella paurometabola]VDR37854.1 HTH-type transcriptional regulator AdhR [Tsukamurella paurometabola]
MVARTEELARIVGTRGPLPDVAELLAGPAQDGPLTVAELAELVGVSGHTLRYYERIGLVTVDRDGAGHRRYGPRAIARVIFLTRLRLSGMPISDITEYIHLVDGGDATIPARLALLTAHRARTAAQIEELQYSLAVIDYKIATYGGALGDCVAAPDGPAGAPGTVEPHDSQED